MHDAFHPHGRPYFTVWPITARRSCLSARYCSSFAQPIWTDFTLSLLPTYFKCLIACLFRTAFVGVHFSENRISGHLLRSEDCGCLGSWLEIGVLWKTVYRNCSLRHFTRLPDILINFFLLLIQSRFSLLGRRKIFPVNLPNRHIIETSITVFQ